MDILYPARKIPSTKSMRSAQPHKCRVFTDNRAMRISQNVKFIIAGLLAGLVNGFLGAGGGLVLVPFFISLCGMEEKKGLATSVAVIFGLSAVSAVVYLKDGLPEGLWACVLGGAAGGLIAGRLMKRVPASLLRRAFALIMIYSSYRMMFT